MSFLNAQVSFPSNFASIFSAIKHNSSVLFYFDQNEPIKLTFECSSQNSSNFSCQFWNDKSVPLENIPSFVILMTHNPSVIVHFLLWIKGSHQRPNFETFGYFVNLPNCSCHFPNHKSVFLHISSVSCKIAPLYFFSTNITYFVQKEPIKVQIF